MVGHIRNEIVPIHFKSQPPTITLANHVHIVIHMDMMQIIVSNCIQSNGKLNIKQPMLVKVKGLGKFKKRKVQLIKG